MFTEDELVDVCEILVLQGRLDACSLRSALLPSPVGIVCEWTAGSTTRGWRAQAACTARGGGGLDTRSGRAR